MIDFDRFWEEPGAMPGLTEEETREYLGQLAPWAQPGVSAEAMFPEGLYPGEGASEKLIADWEAERGVRLPAVLREALRRQDGGYVRETHVRVLPLSEIRPGDDEFWEWASCDDADVTDRNRVVCFAHEDEFSGSYFLNYNAIGPDGEPSVLLHYSDPGELRPAGQSVTKFFERLLRTTDEPKVDWAETESLEVVVRETLDLSPIHGGPATFEQVLCRQAEALVLFVREQAPKTAKLTRTSLPLPLQTGQFAISSIRPHRPAPIGTYGLLLQPQNTEGIVEVQSERTRDGRWKNGTLRGAPLYVLFESTDKGRLEGLRRALLGDEAAAQAQARDEHQNQLEQTMAGLSTPERQATMLQMMLQMQSLFAGPGGQPPSVPADLPAELKTPATLIQETLRGILRGAQEQAASHPPNPDALRLMSELMSGLGKPPAGKNPDQANKPDEGENK